MKKLVQPILLAAICSGAAASHASYIGSLKTEQGVYEVAARGCGVYKEEGAYDIEIYGPGKTPTGEKMYFEFSSTGQSIDINVGVDSQFSSSDNRIQSSGEFKLAVDGQTIQVSRIRLLDQNRQLISQDATFEIDCTAR